MIQIVTLSILMSIQSSPSVLQARILDTSGSIVGEDIRVPCTVTLTYKHLDKKNTTVTFHIKSVLNESLTLSTFRASFSQTGALSATPIHSTSRVGATGPNHTRAFTSALRALTDSGFLFADVDIDVTAKDGKYCFYFSAPKWKQGPGLTVYCSKDGTISEKFWRR